MTHRFARTTDHCHLALPRTRPMTGGLAAGVALLFMVRVASAACTAPASGPVTFISPANGSMDVARFPVMSIAFAASVPCDQTSLQNGVRLYDRVGTQVPLKVFCSPNDPLVVVASPATYSDRLEPATDYFLKVSLGTTDPTQYRRIHFTTSGIKSVFCVSKQTEIWPDNLCATPPPAGRSDFLMEPSGAWQTSCDENFYLRPYPTCDTLCDPTCDPNMGDPAIQAQAGVCPFCSIPAPPPDPDGSTCYCRFDHGTLTVGGWKALCTCTREDAFLAGTFTAYAVVKAATPAPGSNAAAGTAMTVVLDRDIGSSNTSYRLVLKDITHGELDPIAAAPLVPAYNAGTHTLTFSGSGVLANKRYRASLELNGTSVPATRILSVQPHQFEWPFNTMTSVSGPLTSVLPTPRTDGVAYPTQLPDRPHLRFLYGGPVTCGLADTNQPAFVVRPSTTTLGPEVNGVASWIDQDMDRLHLMVFDQLAAGTRYDVFYSQAFKDAACPTCNIATPVARFTVQVPPPPNGTTDVRTGTRTSLQGSELWLPVRPTVINQPYGLKERYATDAGGPHTFLGHVMLVPEPPTDVVAKITVDPDDLGQCTGRRLAFTPEDADGLAQNFIVAADTEDCSLPGKTCPSGYTCHACWGVCTGGPTPGGPCQATSDCGTGGTCTSEGSPACPYNQHRCYWSNDAFFTELTSYCRDVVAPAGGTAIKNACSVEEALRCALSGSTGGVATEMTRMNAPTQAQCPPTYTYTDTYNCVPSGKVAINLAAGQHYGAFNIHARGGSIEAGNQVSHAAPIVFQPSALANNGGTGTADFVGTKVLPADGLPITPEPCKTWGFGTVPVTPPCVEGANCPFPHRCSANDVCGSMTADYICPLSHGICDRRPTDPVNPSQPNPSFNYCLPIAQGRQAQTNGATCSVDPDTCAAGYRCNYGEDPVSHSMVTQCKKQCNTFDDCAPGYTCELGFWLGNWSGLCTRPTPCTTTADCDGYTCAPDPSGMYGGINVCLGDNASAAFDCTGPACTSEWVQVGDPAKNIWRLYWPDHGIGSGGSQIDFAARIGPPSGPLAPLSLLRSIDFPDCDVDPDPVSCAHTACHDWNILTRRGQVDLMVSRLGDAKFPAPYGFWSHGYHAMFGLINDPQAECLSYFGDMQEVSFLDMDGPVSLFIKLPTGTSPSNYRIEGTKETTLAVLNDPFDASLRGIRFAGSPNAMWIDDPNVLSFEGNQAFAPVGLSPRVMVVRDLKTPGDVTKVTFSNNYMNGASTIGGEIKTSNVAITNNTLAEVWAKTFTLGYIGAPTPPTVCPPDVMGVPCNKPTCRTNADCRIPFWDGVASTLSTDPAQMATTPTCAPGPDGIGVCSHGTQYQALFTDNIMINSSGVHGDPYNRRMQRNHFENIIQQEALDAQGTHGFWSFVDNVNFNSDPFIPTAYVIQGPSSSVAIDNNYWVKNAPGEIDADLGKHYPGGGFGAEIIASAYGSTGLRITENTLVSVRGTREFEMAGALQQRYWKQSLISKNTFIGDTFLSIFNDESDSSYKSNGTIQNNLLLTSTRPDLARNDCSTYRKSDVLIEGTSLIVDAGNAVLYKKSSESPYPPYWCLKISDRRNLLREPLPFHPVIDLETLQKHLNVSVDGQLLDFRKWPVYDPALLDDALRVRPQRTIESSTYGAKTDPDGDLHNDANDDNCPGVYNPDQANADGDSLGDACDPLEVTAQNVTTGSFVVTPNPPVSYLYSTSADDTTRIQYKETTNGNNRRLTVIWTIQPAAPMSLPYDLVVEGFHETQTGDSEPEFRFETATTTASGLCTAVSTWNPAVLAVEKRADDDVTQRAFFKSSGTGPVAKFCVRATDDRPSNDSVTDWLTLDRLYLFPSLQPPPDTPAAAEGTAAQSSSDVGGTIINTFAATIASADVREEFAQRSQVPNLVRTWRFDNVPAGSAHQLRIEGSTTGEPFKFQYATEVGTSGNPGTFVDLSGATITSTTEGSADYTFPVVVSGKVWIRVLDNGSGSTSTVKIDQLLIKTTP